MSYSPEKCYGCKFLIVKNEFLNFDNDEIDGDDWVEDEGIELICIAFPNGIPDNVISKGHYKPVKGQEGEFVYTKED